MILLNFWLRGQDLNLRPSGYEPDELPGCSTPRQIRDHAGCAEKQRSNNHGTKITKLVKNTCGWKTRRRPTLPCLKTKYHRRYRLSRPSSEWDRVGHLCHNHLVIQTHVLLRFDRQASNCCAIPSKAKLRRHPKLECMLANRGALAFAFTHG